MLSALDLPPGFVRVFALAWGAIWGSFANVVVYRWPRELSVTRPGSRCPHCGHTVRARDNVPVLGWVLLRGRCRDCRVPISPRYPSIELLYGLLSLVLAERIFAADPAYPLSVACALWMVHFAFAWGLVTASFIDLDTMLIPDAISLPGIALGLGAALILPGITWRESLLGAGLGFGLPYTLYFVWSRFLKREGMGLGDTKLLAMVGALLGPPAVLFALSAGALQGLVATLLARLAGRRLGPARPLDEVPADAPADDPAGAPAPDLMRTQIPFGPFLALGALEYLLGADRLVREYLTLLLDA